MNILDVEDSEQMDELEIGCRFGSYSIQDVLDVIHEQEEEALLN